MQSCFIRAQITYCLGCWFYYDSSDSQINQFIVFDDSYFRQMCVFVHPILTIKI
jgi:hypothetical protein